jgi:hypothetical protein
LQRRASINEQLSIEINVTEEHLRSGTCEINPGQWDYVKKWDEWGH